jgi:E3 ubiquitin-protein ligase RAD18
LKQAADPDPKPIAIMPSNPVPSSNDEVIDITDDEMSKRSSSPIEVLSKRVKLDPDHDFVECPVCGKSMPETFLQSKHIDDCLLGKPTAPYVARKRPNTKSSISSFFRSSPKSNNITSSKPVSSSPPTYLGNRDFYFKDVHKHNAETKKLSKLDFQSLTTPKLKEKLAGLKLSTAGTRVQLELRYNQYYVLYNSNLDSSKPVDEKILKQNLNKWEQSHLAFRSTNADLFAGRGSLSNKSITDKNFLVKQWNEVYNHDFKNLILVAKKSRKVKAHSSEQDGSIQEKEDSLVIPCSSPKNTGETTHQTTMTHHQNSHDPHNANDLNDSTDSQKTQKNQTVLESTSPANESMESQTQN